MSGLIDVSTQAWSPWTETDKACQKKVQQRKNSATDEDRLQGLGLPTLEKRRHQTNMCIRYNDFYFFFTKWSLPDRIWM
jgi:hypothetical protein